MMFQMQNIIQDYSLYGCMQNFNVSDIQQFI